MVCPSTERAHARRDTKESFMVREVLVVESRYNEKTGGLDVSNPSHHWQVPSIYTGGPGRGGEGVTAAPGANPWIRLLVRDGTECPNPGHVKTGRHIEHDGILIL